MNPPRFREEGVNVLGSHVGSSKEDFLMNKTSESNKTLQKLSDARIQDSFFLLQQCLQPKFVHLTRTLNLPTSCWEQLDDVLMIAFNVLLFSISSAALESENGSEAVGTYLLSLEILRVSICSLSVVLQATHGCVLLECSISFHRDKEDNHLYFHCWNHLQRMRHNMLKNGCFLVYEVILSNVCSCLIICNLFSSVVTLHLWVRVRLYLIHVLRTLHLDVASQSKLHGIVSVPSLGRKETLVGNRKSDLSCSVIPNSFNAL